MSDAPQSGEKKIIVDEDWKSQVEAEKRAAQEAAARQQAQRLADQPAAGATSAAEAAEGELPPPNLTFLASTLYLQAMVSLGLLPNPVSNGPKANLPQAKHAIDTLQMLFDKTEGNRTPEETGALDDMLHELRMSFLAVQERAV